ncbi:MAG: right-handed parallel beta-helix repeat-containing protein [Anaerolineaceae bacterium]|nr:right-handed parallel beta-helix repeat-containing protein [Anaerolineaceae bacterium]
MKLANQKGKNLTFRFILIALFSTWIVLINGCNSENGYFTPEYASVIEGLTFSKTVSIQGAEFDRVIIQNCEFSGINGSGLDLRNVDQVIIRNNIFREIHGNAIDLQGWETTSGIVIENNHIDSIDGNGVFVRENHQNVMIRGNTIQNVGLDHRASWLGMPYHGIYCQGMGCSVEGNWIGTVENPGGNAVTMRSNGKVAGNMLFGASKAGISYYSDHPGLDGLLLIENNFIFDNSHNGIRISSNGETENHIGKVVIRFNTILTREKANIAVKKGTEDIDISIFGNILIREDNNMFIFNDGRGSIYEDMNLSHNLDVGFADFQARDLHLKLGSFAEQFEVNEIEDFPELDIEGDERDSKSLNVGADQVE